MIDDTVLVSEGGRKHTTQFVRLVAMNRMMRMIACFRVDDLYNEQLQQPKKATLRDDKRFLFL